MKFVIGAAEKKRRWRNIAWGLFFSVLLAGVIGFQNYRYPEKFSELLLWSVLGFVILANLINYIRHLRYMRMIKDHYLEVLPEKLRFSTAGEVSELDTGQISALRVFRRRGEPRHIQILLKNNRGIRLEGYQGLNELTRLLSEQIPAEKIMK